VEKYSLNGLGSSVEFFLAHSRGVPPKKEQQKGCLFSKAAVICNLEVAQHERSD
jgi:hypothetical protein